MRQVYLCLSFHIPFNHLAEIPCSRRLLPWKQAAGSRSRLNSSRFPRTSRMVFDNPPVLCSKSLRVPQGRPDRTAATSANSIRPALPSVRIRDWFRSANSNFPGPVPPKLLCFQPLLTIRCVAPPRVRKRDWFRSVLLHVGSGFQPAAGLPPGVVPQRQRGPPNPPALPVPPAHPELDIHPSHLLPLIK